MKTNMLSQEEIANIRKSVDIVEVISGYIPLVTKGKNFFGVCPFHSDHSPSMSVSKERQIYTCFSCGASGTVFNFIMDFENISFIEAVKIVAEKGGMPLKIGNYQAKSKDKYQVLYDIYDTAQKFYKNNIYTSIGKNAREYLKGRQFDDNVIKHFEIGLSMNSYDSLTKLLIQKKFDPKDLIRTGLVSKGEKGYNDVYMNRIMFPLYDLTGRIVGYSGRIYHGEKTSKYFNTKETELFKKGELLYNYHRAKESARETATIIIVEGFFALIRLYTIGITNVVATLGTAVTKSQAVLIKRLARNVILCFDGDEAGNDATNACIKELDQVGVIPKIIRLEDKLDPDDYILKYGEKRMYEKLKNPINVMDYKLNYYKKNKDLSNTYELSDYVNKIIDEINKIDNDVYKELTLKKLSLESGLDLDFLKGKLQETKKEKKRENPKEKVKLIKTEIAERNLVYYMLNSSEVVKIYNNQNPYLNIERYRKLAREISLYYKEHHSIEIADLFTEFEKDDKIMSTVQELLKYNLKESYKIEEIMDYINVIREENIDNEIKDLQDRMRFEIEPSKKAEMGQRILELKKMKYNNGDGIHD